MWREIWKKRPTAPDGVWIIVYGLATTAIWVLCSNAWPRFGEVVDRDALLAIAGTVGLAVFARRLDKRDVAAAALRSSAEAESARIRAAAEAVSARRLKQIENLRDLWRQASRMLEMIPIRDSPIPLRPAGGHRGLEVINPSVYNSAFLQYADYKDWGVWLPAATAVYSRIEHAQLYSDLIEDSTLALITAPTGRPQRHIWDEQMELAATYDRLVWAEVGLEEAVSEATSE